MADLQTLERLAKLPDIKAGNASVGAGPTALRQRDGAVIRDRFGAPIRITPRE